MKSYEQYVESPTWQHAIRTHAVKFYLDFTNNYLTVEKIAEHHGLTVADAESLIKMGKKYHESHALSA